MVNIVKQLKKDAETINAFKYAPARTVQAINRLMLLRKKGHWAVIEEILKIWAAEKPNEYQSFVITIKDIRETRKKTWVGTKEFSGVTKKGGGYGRAILDLPTRVFKMIRAIYKADELPMDKKFFLEFIKRFPKFRVSEAV